MTEPGGSLGSSGYGYGGLGLGRAHGVIVLLVLLEFLRIANTLCSTVPYMNRPWTYKMWQSLPDVQDWRCHDTHPDASYVPVIF